ncbi:dimethyl sulfoxide reductase anchor subunit family protein [Thiosocius teredinicola]|uniref:dimethyl sulfoxide reductase anchor subunit family protein n=1 Tax=Thiosocius teredinicola TaxID=1973002 RepID=UPI000990A8FD
MHPAFSVIFLTTLIGAGQGLFMALVTGQFYSMLNLLAPQDSVSFYATGSLLSLALLVLGLFASFFHLGHPERAWRAASKWRTSWLSREVIALPAFMGLVALYGISHYFGWTQPWIVIKGQLPVDATLVLGVLGVLMAVILFVCTAMIYASLRFLQEWHTPLTVANFILFGLASGFTLAAAFSAWTGVGLVVFYGTWAVIFTILAAITRGFSMYRNSRIKHKSTLRSAIGIRHTTIRQKSMGFMGGSFNTREFFHGASGGTLTMVKLFFAVMVFMVPVVLLAMANLMESAYLPLLAFAAQYVGLMAERWYFFAEAKHPQNLYYQSVA